MKMSQFIERVLRPRAETTTIPEVLTAAISRQQNAASRTTEAVEALLVHMERPREAAKRPPKE